MTKNFNEPVLRNGIYCSPSCGGKCTLLAFEKATQDADDLCQVMGDGWLPHVWENLGWHYSVGKGCATIRKSQGRYSAWIEPKIEVGGGQIKTAVQFIEYADNPEDALGFAKQAARTHVARLNQALEDILA